MGTVPPLVVDANCVGRPDICWMLLRDKSRSAVSPEKRLFLGCVDNISHTCVRMSVTVSSGSKIGNSQLVGKNSTVLLFLVACVAGM